MKSETKLFIGIIVGTIAIIAVGIVFLSKPAAQKSVDPALLVRAESDRISTPSAKVTLVEFSDFECPACGVYYGIVNKLVQENKSSMTFVYRNFPLTDVHKNALPAAKAAEAAGLQGKYWEMHDLLFTKQSEWSGAATAQDVFTQYAGQLGLNTDQFKKDMDSDIVSKKIREDIQDGTAIGISATPTFFLNNKQIVNPPTLADFQQLIKTELSK